MREPSPPTPLPGTGEMSKDPMRAAQANMRPKPVRRFFKAVELGEADGRHALLLDGRGARTPEETAVAIAAELIQLRWGGSGSVGRDDVPLVFAPSG